MLIRDFMMAAHERDMADGDYVYITTDLLAVDNYERRWQTGHPKADLATRHAFEPLLQASRYRQPSSLLITFISGSEKNNRTRLSLRSSGGQ